MTLCAAMRRGSSRITEILCGQPERIAENPAYGSEEIAGALVLVTQIVKVFAYSLSCNHVRCTIYGRNAFDVENVKSVGRLQHGIEVTDEQIRRQPDIRAE